MESGEINANLRRQSAARIGAIIGWAVFTVAATMTKDTSLAMPAAALWITVTIAAPVLVIRHNRAIDARMRTASTVVGGGYVTSAYAASRVSLGNQAICACFALGTYLVSGRFVANVLDTNGPTPLPFVVGIGSAILAYRAVKARLVA